MPIWLYDVSPLLSALIIIAFIEFVSLVGLFLSRRFLLPRFHYGEGINDAVSGTVQAIGVFYGITVGLIAVGVWNTNTSAADLVSREASASGALYRDLGGYPSPLREELRKDIRDYTAYVIDVAWPAQRKNEHLVGATEILDNFQAKLYAFEPTTQGQAAMHRETLEAYNKLVDYRHLRIDAVNSGLSGTMWAVIWIGAAISIGVAYLYNILDPKLHAVLIFLMAGFLALVLFMITINDRPFYGKNAISSTPYQLILERLMQEGK